MQEIEVEQDIMRSDSKMLGNSALSLDNPNKTQLVDVKQEMTVNLSLDKKKVYRCKAKACLVMYILICVGVTVFGC